MTSTGQVLIPEDVRKALGLHPGDLVRFSLSDGGVRIVRGIETGTLSFEDRLARARALASPPPLGMTTDEYMSRVREPISPHPE